MDSVPRKELSLFDSICIIVGIIIGAGIYEVTPTVAACMGGWKGIIGIWLAGGVLALTGAICYAELATAYPHEGGDYVYQSRAYGSLAGYLFGWSQLFIIRPGDIALLAFVFARYAMTLYSPSENMLPVYASMAVIILTLINILGVKKGKWTQNLLTIIKAAGILAIVVAGFFAPAREMTTPETTGITMEGFELALILVLFTFGGWNEMAYVAAEVKHPGRNIVRSLVIGTVFVTITYMLVNGSFLYALGQEKMSTSDAIAVDTLGTIAPVMAARVISIIICLSALGAVNGLIFTGARISYAMGAGHRSFRALGKWSPRYGTPIRALIVQGCLSVAILLLAGSFIETILYTAPVAWLFFLATGISVFVLRKKEPHIERPYKISGFPITAVIFCAACVFMCYSSVTYALAMKPVGLIVVLSVFVSGIFVYWFTDKRARV